MTAPDVGAADTLAALCRRVDAVIAWKIDHDQRAEARFHQRRRQARRRRHQRADSRRTLVSTVARRWRR